MPYKLYFQVLKLVPYPSRKPRFREVKSLPQGHSANKYWTQHLTHDCLTIGHVPSNLLQYSFSKTFKNVYLVEALDLYKVFSGLVLGILAGTGLIPNLACVFTSPTAAGCLLGKFLTCSESPKL